MSQQSTGKFQVGIPVSKIIADLLMVHTCLIFTLVGSWIRSTQSASDAFLLSDARANIHEYLHVLLPLSLVFPIVFSIAGFYEDHSTFSVSKRVMILLRGIALALAVFATTCLLVIPGTTFGVRSLSVFSTCLIGVLASARLSEWLIQRRGLERAKEVLDQHSPMPVLVVGGAGYIGSILVRKLLDGGHKVRVLDSFVYGDGALREVLDHPNLELTVGDCRNLQTVTRAIKGMDAIIHLAAIVGDPACAQDTATALEVNYAATRMLIEIAKGNGIRRFVFASSCSVYGASEELMTENSSVNPISVYAQTKVDSEQALLEAHCESFQPTILRLATVFGLSPRPRFDLVVNLLTARACRGDKITIFNGQQWRPFIHVDDVAEAMIAVLKAPVGLVGGEIFNVGDNRLNYTLTQVAEKLMETFPGAAVEHVASADRRNYRVSFDKILKRLGFECTRDLQDGIQEIREAFAESRIMDYTSYQYNNQKFLQVAGSPLNQDDVDQSVMAAFAQVKPLKRATAAGL